MFRPVVAIIRSLSFDTLKIILYKIILRVSTDKDLMMASICRNM